MKTNVLTVALALIALAAAFVGFPLSQAAWPDKAEVQSDDKEIARLVKQLGSEVFKDREAARQRLEEIGEPALDALAEANSSLEVRRRAETIIGVIEIKLQRRLIGHTDSVDTVYVSADGKRLLTSSRDNTLRLWDADTGKQLHVFNGHTAAFSLDGQRVLSNSSLEPVRLWDATTGKELPHGNGPGGNVVSVALSPEGRKISGSTDGKACLWDLNASRYANGQYIAYSDKAKLVASSGTTLEQMNASIRLVNLETGKEVRTLAHGYSGMPLLFCFSGEGKRLASANSLASNQYYAEAVRIWDVETGKELRRIVVPQPTSCIAISPDGKRIATGGGYDYTVRVWDIETGKELRRYEGHTRSVFGVTFFPDGKRIASVSYDRTARIWRAPR